MGRGCNRRKSRTRSILGESDLKKHTWKIVAVVLMLVGMFIYLYTLDETVRAAHGRGSEFARAASQRAGDGQAASPVGRDDGLSNGRFEDGPPRGP